MDQCYARICWNTNRWAFPSGDAPKLEKNTYASKNGFGHEEWLFNFPLTLSDGYHYAYLEPVSRSSQRTNGKILDILLWAINASKERVQIGEIKSCQVLTDSQSLEAFDHYAKNGLIERLKQDVARVGGNKDKLSGPGIFNIRFLPRDAIQYDPFPVAKSTDKIAKLKRYTLVPASGSNVDAEWRVRTRQGSTTIPTSRKHIRAGSQGGTVDPYHPVLQAELMKLLQKQFGKDNVVCESDWVDLTVSYGKKKMLIEIKTDAVAKSAIREALGQILEYAYFSSESGRRRETENTELFIVAPGVANKEVSAYLNMLRNRFQIPIQYCSFLPSGQLPEVFMRSQ